MARLDDYDLLMAKHIAEYGIGITAVFPDESSEHKVSFAYTTGLAEVDEPELLVFGLNSTVAHPLLNQIYAEWVKGEKLKDGSFIPEMLGAEGEFGVYLILADKNKAAEYATGSARRFALATVIEQLNEGKITPEDGEIKVPDELSDGDGHFLPVPVLQVVIPDLNGLYPWDEEYALPHDLQPCLSEITDTWDGFLPLSKMDQL